MTRNDLTSLVGQWSAFTLGAVLMLISPSPTWLRVVGLVLMFAGVTVVFQVATRAFERRQR